MTGNRSSAETRQCIAAGACGWRRRLASARPGSRPREASRSLRGRFARDACRTEWPLESSRVRLMKSKETRPFRQRLRSAKASKAAGGQRWTPLLRAAFHTAREWGRDGSAQTTASEASRGLFFNAYHNRASREIPSTTDCINGVSRPGAKHRARHVAEERFAGGVDEIHLAQIEHRAAALGGGGRRLPALPQFADPRPGELAFQAQPELVGAVVKRDLQHSWTRFIAQRWPDWKQRRCGRSAVSSLPT